MKKQVKKQLSEIMKEIKALEESASKVNGINSSSHSKRDAVKLNREVQNYYMESIVNSIFITSVGKDADKLSSKIQKFGGFVVDIDQFVTMLLETVPLNKVLKKKPGVGLESIINQSLENIVTGLGISYVGKIKFNRSKYQELINTKQDLIRICTDSITDCIDGEILGIFAVNIACQDAIAKNYDGNMLPILINSSDDKILNLFLRDIKKINENCFTVTTDDVSSDFKFDKTSKEDIQKVLVEIKKRAIKK